MQIGLPVLREALDETCETFERGKGRKTTMNK